MTQEEKQLLLVDICAREPYHVLGLDCFGKLREMQVIYPSGTIIAKEIDGENCSSCGFKPYLRPMSSMTVSEGFEYNGLRNETADFDWEIISHKIYDWLNKHHFDYRGLIEKGLALEAPEDMYNINTK